MTAVSKRWSPKTEAGLNACQTYSRSSWPGRRTSKPGELVLYNIKSPAIAGDFMLINDRLRNSVYNYEDRFKSIATNSKNPLEDSTMSKRQQLKEQRRRKSMVTNILWGSSLLVVFAVVGYIIWSSATTPPKPAVTGTPQATLLPPGSMVGEAVAVDPDRGHIADNSDPGPYSTNPPTSGHHYATWKQAGFYDTNTDAFPQAYLVHNLEHGYIIFWYNCTILSDAECTDLKTQIKTVMDGAGNFKVIAYP